MKRNRIIYFILCIASVVLASFYGGPISYSILFGVLLVAPVALIYLFTVFFFFKIYQVLGTKHITTYEPIPYYFILKNEYLLNFCHISVSTYSTFSYIDELQKSDSTDSVAPVSGIEKVYELLPGESVRYDTTLICRYRGDYFVGIKEITIIDFFRLFKITYHVPEPLGASVLPRIIKLEGLKSAPDITKAAYKENPKQSSYFDSSVREYVPGDPLKGIHWKSTAKTGKLQSRITYGEQRQGISIFLDTKRISEDEYVYIPIEYRCLEIVLALTDYFTAFSVPTTAFFSQSDIKTASCSASYEMDSFLATISKTRFRNDENAAIALDMLLNSSSFKDCMIVFLIITSADVELNKRLYELSALGIKTVIYYVGYNPQVKDIMELSDQTVIPVNPEDDLVSVL